MGHLRLSEYVVNEVKDVDGVLLSVTPQNPLKAPIGGASDAERLEMARRAVQNICCVEVTDIEFSLPRPNYTYATLAALQARDPDTRFTLMIGADNWLIFPRWRAWREIIAEYGVLIYPRPGFEIDTASLPREVRYLADAPVTDISSTQIREAIAAGSPINNMLAPDVYNYIKEKKIYRTNAQRGAFKY